MRVRTVILKAIALMSLIGVTAVGHADDRKDIDALYNKVAKAMMAKDVNGIVAAGTKDFFYTEAGKTMTGDRVVAQMKQQFQIIKGSPKCKMTVVSCKITGKTAAVVSGDVTEMEITGQDGKPHKFVATGKSKDVLMKTDKGWLMKSVVVTSNVMTMDGKPYDPTKATPAQK